MRDNPTNEEPLASSPSTSESTSESTSNAGDMASSSIAPDPAPERPPEPEELETARQPGEAEQPGAEAVSQPAAAAPTPELAQPAQFARAQQPAWPVRLALTEEELAVLLRGLQAESLPGFRPAWAPENLTHRIRPEAEPRLEFAVRSLTARGILIPPEQPEGVRNAWILPAAIYGLLGACAFADVSLHLQARIARTSHEVYLHGLEDVAVLHTAPMALMHEFTYLGPKAALARAVCDFFSIRGQRALDAFPPFAIPPEDFQEVRAWLARGDFRRAENILRRHGCAKEAAGQLCAELAVTQVTGAITIGRYAQGGERRTVTYSWALLVAPAPRTLFLLEDEPTPAPRKAPPRLIVRSIGADDLLRQLSGIIHAGRA